MPRDLWGNVGRGFDQGMSLGIRGRERREDIERSDKIRSEDIARSDKWREEDVAFRGKELKIRQDESDRKAAEYNAKKLSEDASRELAIARAYYQNGNILGAGQAMIKAFEGVPGEEVMVFSRGVDGQDKVFEGISDKINTLVVSKRDGPIQFQNMEEAIKTIGKALKADKLVTSMENDRKEIEQLNLQQKPFTDKDGKNWIPEYVR